MMAEAFRAAPIGEFEDRMQHAVIADCDPTCARMHWINTTSAERVATSSDPGAGSAISDASILSVVCSARLCA
jgi:hypothetical protein